MNINSLRKKYGKLTPIERITALIRAVASRDESEYQALVDSALRENYRVSHHYFIASDLPPLFVPVMMLDRLN